LMDNECIFHGLIIFITQWFGKMKCLSKAIPKIIQSFSFYKYNAGIKTVNNTVYRGPVFLLLLYRNPNNIPRESDLVNIIKP